MSQTQRKEALLNEYKGSMFEFLVALSLAREIGSEPEFLSELSPNFFTILEQQENFLRNFYPKLLKALPDLASEVVQNLLSSIGFQNEKYLITVAGKSLASDKNSDLAETDLILKSTNSKILISLKLSKANSFVNTKSAGLKSVITRYMKYDIATKLQDQFVKYCEHEFKVFVGQMCQEANLDFSDNFKQWEEQGLPVLPGELSGEYREYLLAYYEKVSKKLFNIFSTLLADDSEAFKEGALALMGYGISELYQVTCFYKSNADSYSMHKCEISKSEDFDSSELTLVENKGNFEVHMPKKILQIRIKPMNKFTQFAYKLNCSIKTLA